MKFQVRPYQETCIANVIADLEVHDKVCAVLGTGAGKSLIFMRVVQDFITKNPDKSVLILSHLSLLTTQTRNAFKQFAPHIKVGIFQAEQRPAPDCHVYISTMQSSRIEGKAFEFNNRIENDIGLAVVDEFHYITTDSYKKALSHFPKAKQFGVTATPFRERRLMTSYFDKISFSISLQELINDGFLVEPKLHQIVHDSESVEEMIALLVRTYQEKEQGNKAIFFMQTIEDAKQLRNAFEDVRINAEAVTSEMVGENRDDILKQFNTTDLNVLTTVNVLTAGFDAPNVRAIFMPYPTTSPTLYMQRIGRGLRPFEGKTGCNVYVVGNAPSISTKTFEQIHRHALNGTAEWKEYDTLKEDLQYNFPESDCKQYQWTQQTVEIAERLEALGVRKIADMLIAKRFPKKFMGNLVEFANAIAKAPRDQFNGMVTKAQGEMLQKYGFDVVDVSKLTKTEAGIAISAMRIMFQDKGPFVVASGKFAGKHIADLPYHYKAIVMAKFPNSNVAKMIRQWNEEKRA